MKKIGILGGLAWPTTVEYYRAICQLSQEHHAQFDIPGPSPMPEMCIESVNLNHSYSQRGIPGDEGSWQNYDAYFHAALKRLEDNGVDFAIIASNTPHNRFDAITKGLRVPMISIFQAVVEACKAQGIRDFLLLGTEPTMNAGVFPQYFGRYGIQAIPPKDEEIKRQVAELISELFKGENNNGRARLAGMVDSALDQLPLHSKAVCLACTELPLAFKGCEQRQTFQDNGVLYLNTGMIHVNAAFRYAIQD